MADAKTDAKTIEMRPLDNFSTNGVLKGGVAAFDPDDGTLLWEADCPNWRRPGVVEQTAAMFLKEMTTDFPEYRLDASRAESLLRLALREARRAQAASDKICLLYTSPSPRD